MNSIITNNLDKIQFLCKQHNVKELYAFGSVTDEKKFNEKSDVDLLVEFGDVALLEYADNYFEFADELEEVFKRKVDLLTIRSLENPYFIQSINRSKKKLYEA